MKAIGWFLVSLVASTSALAEAINAPALRSGDTWVYRDTAEVGPSGWTQTRDQVAIVRVTGSSIYYTIRQDGSSQPPQEKIATIDWGRVRSVNGKEAVVNRPLSFPMTVGRTWQVEYSEDHPNKAQRRQDWKSTFKVIGYEDVTVPAGTFHALKIEAEGSWVAELEPTQGVVQGMQRDQGAVTVITKAQTTRATTATGRTYKAYWYVPEIKRWVKLIEEYYSENGVRNERYTNELESFKAGT